MNFCWYEEKCCVKRCGRFSHALSRRLPTPDIWEISLLSVPGKVYGRVLSERMIKITEGSIGSEQGRFR